LDTRELEEYGVSHLPGAIHFGYNQPKWSTLFMVDKEKTVVVYCSVGYRSERIGEELLKRGYKKVYNLYGGIFDWVNQGYTVFRGDKATNKVHPYNKSWGRWLTKGEKAYR
jgi:rhodanese-related sulfurtransferase